VIADIAVICTKNRAVAPMTAMSRDHGDDGDFRCASLFLRL
jgi:hypothetical protein